MNTLPQIIIFCALGALIVFILIFIIKSIASPKKIEGIQRLLKQGKTAAAEKLAKTIIAKDPRDFVCHYWLGETYLAEDKTELGFMEFKLVNQNALFDGSIPELQFRKKIAALYLRFNQPEESLKEYLLLTKMEPHNADNFFNVGKIYESENRGDLALGFYQKAISIDRHHTQAHASLGYLLFRSKQFGEAKKEIDLAISLNPEAYSNYFFLGKILKENKDYSSALANFEKAERDPEYRQRALIERGSCYMNDLLDFINTTIISTVHADGGAVLLVDDFDDVIAVKSFSGDFPPPYKLPSDMPHKPVRVATNFKFASFPLHDNIFGEVATSGKPELITKPEADDRIYQNGPEEFLECGSYLIIPMKLQDTVIGVMALSRKHGNALFTEEDLKTTATLSEFAAAAIKSVISVKDVVEHSEITKEADIACRIQETLHPAKLPALPGVFTGVFWNPAEGVCGDYYDIIPSRKDRISFVVADIAGKGTNSMFSSLVRLAI